MGMTACIVTLAFMNLTEPQSCNAVGQALLVLWMQIAAVFLVSVVVVGVVAWQVMPSVSGRLALVVAYGAVLAASYVVIAFGLMVALNC
jgi:hypothetical protein